MCNCPASISSSLLYHKIYIMRNNILFLSLAVLLFSCSNNNQTENNSNVTKSERPTPGNHKSVGSLSFKLNGEFFEADPGRAKAWTTNQVPLAMLMAKNDKGLSVSMQMQNIMGKGTYKLDGDSKGNVNFTVNGKTYWTRSVKGDNYLNVVITSTKNQATVVLLSGTFDGVLEDKDGNIVQITEGRFTTESL